MHLYLHKSAKPKKEVCGFFLGLLLLMFSLQLYVFIMQNKPWGWDILLILSGFNLFCYPKTSYDFLWYCHQLKLWQLKD